VVIGYSYCANLHLGSELRDGGKNRCPLGAIGHAVGGVLHIASDENLTGAGQNRRPNSELRVRSVGVFHCLAGGQQQPFSHGRRNNFLAHKLKGFWLEHEIERHCKPSPLEAGVFVVHLRVLRPNGPVVSMLFKVVRFSSMSGKAPHVLNPSLAWQDVARMIDHTNLRPEATADQIKRLCQEAREFGFATVMVNAFYIELAAAQLKGSEVRVGAVVGFPLGATLTSVKLFETTEALRLGAREVDMVLAIGALKSGNHKLVLSDIQALAEKAHAQMALLKVILETGLLTQDEKVLACRLSAEAGADFVKTSTGFLGGGATVADIELMRRTVGPHIGVKASGGIRSAQDTLAMIRAGATRIGTSSGVAIVRELQKAA